jgi:hypothetical protein
MLATMPIWSALLGRVPAVGNLDRQVLGFVAVVAGVLLVNRRPRGDGSAA